MGFASVQMSPKCPSIKNDDSGLDFVSEFDSSFFLLIDSLVSTLVVSVEGGD